MSLKPILMVISFLIAANSLLAQTPSFDALMPAAVKSSSPDYAAYYAATMQKVIAFDPKIVERVKVTKVYGPTFFDFRKFIMSSKDNATKSISSGSYDSLTTVFSIMADNRSAMMAVFRALRDSLPRAKSAGDVLNDMAAIMNSTMFSKLSASDKEVFHKAFMYAKVGMQDAAKNNFVNSNGKPVVMMIFDLDLGAKSLVSANGVNARRGCYFVMWCIPGVKPDHAYRVCDGRS